MLDQSVMSLISYMTLEHQMTRRPLLEWPGLVRNFLPGPTIHVLWTCARRSSSRSQMLELTD